MVPLISKQLSLKCVHTKKGRKKRIRIKGVRIGVIRDDVQEEVWVMKKIRRRKRRASVEEEEEKREEREEKKKEEEREALDLETQKQNSS